MTTPAPKKSASHTLEMKNHEALSKLSAQFHPVVISPENALPPTKSDFFERLDMASEIETNSGLHFIIDEQPDFRFPLYS